MEKSQNSEATEYQLGRKLLPIREFSRIMGISIWYGRRLAYEGRISSNKIGRKLLVPASECERLAKETLRPAVNA